MSEIGECRAVPWEPGGETLNFSARVCGNSERQEK